MKKNLLILLSGNSGLILGKIGQELHTIEIRKIDEKDLSRFGFMRGTIKSGNYDKVIFGTQDISFQRFTYFISLFLLFSGRLSGCLVDEQGSQKRFSLIRFLIIETPMFIAELIASGVVAVYFYIKFPLKLKQVRRKK